MRCGFPWEVFCNYFHGLKRLIESVLMTALLFCWYFFCCSVYIYVVSMRKGHLFISSYIQILEKPIIHAKTLIFTGHFFYSLAALAFQWTRQVSSNLNPTHTECPFFFFFFFCCLGSMRSFITEVTSPSIPRGLGPPGSDQVGLYWPKIGDFLRPFSSS